jgi:hypothetical protein
MHRPLHFIRLAVDAQDNGLHCTPTGLTLAGHPLLRNTGTGLTPRSVADLQKIFDNAYGENSGMRAEAYIHGLASVARFLNMGDVPLAMIGSLMLKLPEVTGAITPAKNTSNPLTKAGFNDSQLRDEPGRWSLEGGDEAPEPPYANDNVEPPPVAEEEAPALSEEVGEATSRAAPKLLRALGPRALGLLGGFIEIAGSPVTLTAGVVLTATNESNMKSGEIPGAPGLTYLCDEGV